MKIGRCALKHIQNKGQNQPVIVFTEPIQILYSGLNGQIGDPKEIGFEKLRTEGKFDMSLLRIPNEIIKRHFDFETHEIEYADGGSSLISELDPEMKGNWRMKIRVLKKGDIKCWQNAKGEGQLLNMELIDR